MNFESVENVRSSNAVEFEFKLGHIPQSINVSLLASIQLKIVSEKNNKQYHANGPIDRRETSSLIMSTCPITATITATFNGKFNIIRNTNKTN